MRNDQIFTPAPIVAKMLDKLEYFGDNIKTKTIFEPSFGAGAFLKQITYRILDYAKEHKLSKHATVAILDNVHGVEIDQQLYNTTKKELKYIVKDFGVNYEWDQLLCADTTTLAINQKYDLCVGNPPFIRCHDYSEADRKRFSEQFKFGQGNTDLYIIFFELAINSLKPDGKMCFITPNSFLKNSSQKRFREYLSKKSIVESIDDYANVPVFGKIATYTAITLINMTGVKETTYSMMADMATKDWDTSVELNKLNSSPWSFVCKSDEEFMKMIGARKTKLSDLCSIQYGLATNSDSTYLIDEQDACKFESEILRPVIKGSTLASDKRIIFPYTFNTTTDKYELIDENALRINYPKTYAYLCSKKDVLECRDLEKNAVWYQYGRSQGINNSRNPKIILKHIVDKSDVTCSITLADENTLVYSGMFIVLQDPTNALRVMQALTSNEFCRYVKLMGKDMSGGYKSFNTKIVKSFGIEKKEND